jgi:hypothetical protein
MGRCSYSLEAVKLMIVTDDRRVLAALEECDAEPCGIREAAARHRELLGFRLALERSLRKGLRGTGSVDTSI